MLISLLLKNPDKCVRDSVSCYMRELLAKGS